MATKKKLLHKGVNKNDENTPNGSKYTVIL